MWKHTGVHKRTDKGVASLIEHFVTYAGSWRTLVENGGFSVEDAKHIEAEYHKLYQVADKWTSDKLREASIRGYVELAFGLRLRTPLLQQVLFDSQTGLPKEAHKEMKTAGNALGQGYGLLNTRAANDFMNRVWNSKYRTDILPVAQIHDAQYYVIKNTVGCLHWVNKNLIDAMQWCELEELQHPTVKLGAKLELYYPTWADRYVIPNDLSKSDLLEFLHQQKLNIPKFRA